MDWREYGPAWSPCLAAAEPVDEARVSPGYLRGYRLTVREFTEDEFYAEFFPNTLGKGLTDGD